jgi:hypothetical protein
MLTKGCSVGFGLSEDGLVRTELVIDHLPYHFIVLHFGRSGLSNINDTKDTNTTVGSKEKMVGETIMFATFDGRAEDLFSSYSEEEDSGCLILFSGILRLVPYVCTGTVESLPGTQEAVRVLFDASISDTNKRRACMQRQYSFLCMPMGRHTSNFGRLPNLFSLSTEQ